MINAIVYAEFAIGFEAQPDCDAEIEKFDLTLAEIPKSAAFRAAQAFQILSPRRRSADRRIARLLYRSARQRGGGAIAHPPRDAIAPIFQS